MIVLTEERILGFGVKTEFIQVFDKYGDNFGPRYSEKDFNTLLIKIFRPADEVKIRKISSKQVNENNF